MAGRVESAEPAPTTIVYDVRGGSTSAVPGRAAALAHRQGWVLDSSAIACPLRFVWGADDRLLPWPRAAERYRRWFPTADWIELAGVGHAVQLDVPLEAAQLILGLTA
ncbi:hypothetical protein DSM104299_00125 [Baekduia alba]|uniref:alpha/beta fold hydrolase n=1 Tax=Baekduia alba TaxID=2997333 RepID=UPI002341F2CC|nr:alpha/beta hydrolase [Baekduia alba]WCB91454.1 hypothetical protein DSM104299_00125 [Baekduia alba]